MNPTIKSYSIRAALLMAVLLFVPDFALSQQMSFSLRGRTLSADGATILGYTNVVDNSWGCAHWEYSTTLRLISPSGRQGTGSSSGLQASTSLAVGGEDGNYTIVSSGNYSCSCIGGGTAAFGVSDWFRTSKAAVRWRYLGTVENGASHDYGPDDCVTPCIVGHLYYSEYKGQYIHGSGRAIYFGGSWSCRIPLSFNHSTRGQCFGPS